MRTADAAGGLAAQLRSRPVAARSSATTMWVLAVLGLGVAVRAAEFAASPSVTYSDTRTYLAIAASPLTSSVWWAGLRPPTMPLAYRLVGDNVASGLVLQLVLACVAWSVLAVVVMRVIRTPRLRWVALVLVLAFSLSREIAEWDRVALSESISLSLLALLIAALILYVERPSRRGVALVLGLAILWGLARDANAYELLLVAPVFAVAAYAQRGRRALHGTVAAGFLAVFLLNAASANASLRWQTAFYDDMGLRILPDVAATDYFASQGMPVNAALIGRTGRPVAYDNGWYHDPRLVPFRSWARANGQRVYLTFLATHPKAGFLKPASQLVDLLSPLTGVRAYAPRAWAPLNGTLLQGMPSAWLFPDRDVPGVLLAGAIGFAAATALTAGWRRSWLVPAVLVASAVPLAMLIFQADPADLDRHELIPAAQLRLGLWLLLLVAVDAIVVMRLRAGGTHAVEPEEHPRIAAERTSVVYVVARLNIGGVARRLSLLAARMGPEFESVVLTGEADAREGSLVDEVRAAGAVVVHVPGLRRQLSPIADARALWWLYRYLSRTRPQIVSTHTAKAGALGRVAAVAAGVPVRVHTFHGHVLEGYFDPLRTAVFREIERALGALATRVIAVSPEIEADLRRFGIGGDRLTVVRPGFDLERLTSGSRSALRMELGLTMDAPLAGIVGRLAPIKNHALFLQACRLLHERLPEARFLVVGDGELAPALHAEAADLGLADVVLFTGWRRDLSDVYAALDVVVCSSNNEGVPAALVEACAAGRPVVATDVGGVSDLVADCVNGILVGSGDAAALADAIGTILTNPDLALQMGREGRRIASAGYGAQRLVDETAALYRDLLAAPPPAPGSA